MRVILLWVVGCGVRVADVVPTVVREPPELARVWYARGLLAAQLGDAAERATAEGWLRRLDPSNPWTPVALGRIASAAGDAAALAEAARAACAHPQVVPAAAELAAEALGSGDDSALRACAALRP